MALSYKYAYMGTTVLITVFYIPILPLGVVLSFIGMLLMYFVEKFNVLNMYKRPEKIDGRITRTYVDFFRGIIFVYAISSFIFFGGIYKNQVQFELISLIIFSVLLVFPLGIIMRKLELIKDQESSNDDYDDCYFELGFNYEMANPLTKNKGFEKYLSKLLEAKMISDSEYRENIVKIKTNPSDIIELFYKKKYGKTKMKNNNLFKGLLQNKEIYSRKEEDKSNNQFVKRVSLQKELAIKKKKKLFGKKGKVNAIGLGIGSNPTISALNVVSNQLENPNKTFSNKSFNKEKENLDNSCNSNNDVFSKSKTTKSFYN
jgi:hypothetical protein